MIFNKKTASLSSLKNRIKLVSTFRQNKPVVKAVPNIFYIESTNRCNLQCIMCPRTLMTRPQVDMDYALFKSIASQLDVRRTELVVLHSDGEPLLNPDLFKMISFLKDRNMSVMTSTNATLLDTGCIEQILGSGLDILTISVDGTSKDVYERIRRGSDFQMVMKNIDIFLKIKRNRPPFTIIQMILMKENEHQVDEFVQTWEPYRKMNAYPVIKPMTDWFGKHDEMNLNFCDRPWFGMVVQSSGNVVPCVHDFDGKKILGRLPRDNIYDIWNCDEMVALRQKILRGRYASDLCKDCNATSPRKFGLASAIGLSLLDMASISKMLPILGYNRPKQY